MVEGSQEILMGDAVGTVNVILMIWMMKLRIGGSRKRFLIYEFLIGRGLERVPLGKLVCVGIQNLVMSRQITRSRLGLNLNGVSLNCVEIES